MNIKKQLRRLNTFGFFACLRIPDAIWVVLLAARGFNLWQIGLAEGIFHIVGLLCEIPSGMAADLIGRRRSLMMAGLCGMVSALLMVFSSNYLWICGAMVFSALSCSFISGSDEALLYDSLLLADRKEEYLASSARFTQVQSVGSMLSNLASLLAGVFSYVGIYLVDALVCLARVLSAGSLREPNVTKLQAERDAQPLRDLKKRFRSHASQVAAFLRENPKTALLMLADGLVTLPSYLTLMFIQQRLSELGLSVMWIGLPIMGISLARIAGVELGKYLQVKRLRTLYAVCAVLVGAGTVCAGSAPIVAAVLGAMVAAGSMNLWMLHLQKYLNGLFPSDNRATLVSVNMMAYSVLMILASPLVGWLGDLAGTAGAGLLVLGAVVAAAGAVVMLRFKK